MRTICILLTTLLWLASLAQATPLSARRAIGANNLVPVEDVRDDAAYQKLRVVARVETEEGEGFCTAARIGEDLFLTNYHCHDYVPCAQVRFHLGYERDVPASRQQLLRCREVLASSESLDYALYRVEPTDASLRARLVLFDYPTAPLCDGAPDAARNLILASHPGGRLKEVDASSDCRLASTTVEEIADRKTFTHTCDTEGRSSGAPLLDRESGCVVALHWGGSEAINFAVPVPLILEELRETHPELVGTLDVRE